MTNFINFGGYCACGGPEDELSHERGLPQKLRARLETTLASWTNPLTTNLRWLSLFGNSAHQIFATGVSFRNRRGGRRRSEAQKTEASADEEFMDESNEDIADGSHRHCASSESGTPQKDPAAKKDDAKNEDPAAKKDDAKTSAESYEVLMEKARLELATQAEIVKTEKKKKKNDERKLKLKDVRMKDPVVLAKHWADLVVADLTDAKKLVLKLQEDKLSSALTTELHQMNTELEKHFVTLQKFATGVERPSSELVAAAVEGAQAVIDQMRPLFDRGEASVSGLSRKAKKRRTDRGADE